MRKTAGLTAPYVEEDYDDICNLLRIKVWQALMAFDPTKARQPRDQYVFMCVYNRVKDLRKKVKRNEAFIEDEAPAWSSGEGDGPRDSFERQHFSVDEDQVYADALHGDPLIPSTLTRRERTVLLYLYFDYAQAEIAEQMELSRKDVSTAVASIRLKMADWEPGDSVTPMSGQERIAA